MPQRNKKPPLAYGYRVQYRKQGESLSSTLMFWRKKKEGLPPEWKQIKEDPQMVRGRLFKRGRQIDSF